MKIIFSDTNTHYRGVENYRRSGVTDAMQDLLLLGSEARMNTPGVAAANWAFRYVKEDLTEDRSRWLLKTTKLFGRCALSPEDYTL